MRSKTLASLGILLGLAISPAFAQIDSAPDSPLTPSIGPIQLEGADDADSPTPSATSLNWAGYAVTASDLTGVAGSWIVPKYHCLKTPNSNSTVFVGLDGYPSTNTTLEAIGTASNCVGTKYQYYAWYELYPSTYVQISGFSVSSGDAILAEIIYSASTFTFTIMNDTTGKTFTTTGKLSGAKRSSAEWIVAKPSSLPPLMDFGTVNSGGDYTLILGTDWAMDSSITGGIGLFSTKTKINMVDGGVTDASTSALTSDGTSFSVTWKHE
jgi:hypothetical protein